MKKDKLKKIQWFPEAKSITVQLYVLMLIALTVFFIMVLCLRIEAIIYFLHS